MMLLQILLFCLCSHFSDQKIDQYKGLKYRQRLEGMIYGSVIGDAAGGPLEFIGRKQQQGEGRICKGKFEGNLLVNRFRLRSYTRPCAPYAQWDDYAAQGTITDDTRFKMIMMQMIRKNHKTEADAFAQEVLQFEERFRGTYRKLCKQWLAEFKLAALWHLNKGGLPPDRMWGGTPSMAGQMPFLLLAGLYPNQPGVAYLKTWEMNFFDTGNAKDMNAAIVAGLSAAFADKASWKSIEKAIREVDPFKFGNATYGRRSIDKWLDFAHEAVKQSHGCPHRLFSIIEKDVQAEQWWECWVPLVVVFACAEFSNYDPIAGMQLVLEFGHDTDSYAQLMGAFMGALHGKEIFKDSLCQKVRWRMIEQYGEDLETWINDINALQSNFKSLPSTKFDH